MKLDIKEKTQSRGFTLIEILVSITIFSIIVGSASGIFISAIKAQRRMLASQELLDNISSSLEYISRALRMAKKDDIDGVNCLSGNKTNYEITHFGQGIRFRNYHDECQEFYLEGKRLKESKPSYPQPLFLTPANLEVVSFRIGPDQSWDQEDTEQPRVTIFFKIKGKEGSEIKIQTTISQRNLDISQ